MGNLGVFKAIYNRAAPILDQPFRVFPRYRMNDTPTTKVPFFDIYSAFMTRYLGHQEESESSFRLLM